MKYTVNIIDTEEKFRKKFGSDSQWIISTPYGNQKKRGSQNIKNDTQPKKKYDQET